MVAQIGRTERWLDQCCQPVELGLYTYAYARDSYVWETVFALETSHLEVVMEMLPLSSASNG